MSDPVLDLIDKLLSDPEEDEPDPPDDEDWPLVTVTPCNP